MRLVLEKLGELGAKSFAGQTVEEARAQPTSADAVKAVMSETTASTTPDAVTTKDIMIPGAEGEVPGRVYTPAAAGDGPMPVILYFHGGGWVIANIDVYDATPRALAEKTGAVVISSSYRQAPEHKFPAAHDDAIAAYKWVVENAGQYNGDTARIAVVGESAGGNLAANVAIAARDQKLQAPVHQVLVYPVAGNDMETPSYQENANAVPLDKPSMKWFVDHVLAEPSQKDDPRLNLVDRPDLEGLAPATVVTAEIDPLRSEGQELAKNLEAAGVDTEIKDFEGASHEFFGMAPTVADATEAQEFVVGRLKTAFAK
ncbi:MAG: alpha/beta hydrolase [Pseudaminobacter sp.]|nr:alpha/beta hydrolase [Pseudaminobacter sp.]